jgi:hypothetical protein
MSLIPAGNRCFDLEAGKFFRNVVGSSVHGTIGKGDLYPLGLKPKSWIGLYTYITGVNISDGFICPSCLVHRPAKNIIGGHIVLGPENGTNIAPASIDLKNAGDYFSPDTTTTITYNNLFHTPKALIPNSNRVFLLPICKNCNSQSGDMPMSATQKVARLMCYGYTDDYQLYAQNFESRFFFATGKVGDSSQQNQFYKLYKRKMSEEVTKWQREFGSPDANDARYLIISAPSSSSSSSSSSSCSSSSSASMHTYNLRIRGG